MLMETKLGTTMIMYTLIWEQEVLRLEIKTKEEIVNRLQ